MSRSEKGGVYIPPAVIADSRLNCATKILFSIILNLNQNTPSGYCFASDRYFAKQLGVGTRQIGRMLHNLEGLGLIQRETYETEYATKRIILSFPEYLTGNDS